MSSPVQDLIDSVYAESTGNCSGEIYSGVAAQENVDPDSFGICVATADGEVYEVGDTGLEFAIQSISKPFTYGIALTDCGIEAVDAKVDIEPSGEVYNEISLHSETRRPRNPMINSGAIVAASMVGGESVAEQARRITDAFSAYAGRELRVDEELFEAQLASGHRNRAIGHMLREFEILEDDPDMAHEVYLRACSTMVTCRDLSLMGAAWANGGVHPVSGERLLDVGLTERVLSVMATCGMYDAAGRWVAEVGMPAKSGVSGGIVAVLPGQLSIAALSPRLNEHGNSVRAFEACRKLSRKLELHAMHAVRGARGAIRDAYDIRAAPSSLQRPEADRRVIEEHGAKARIYELHGDLFFSGAESVVREITAAGTELDLIAVDVRRVSDTSQVALELLAELRTWLRAQVCEGFVIDPEGLLPAPAAETGPGSGSDHGSHAFPTIAAATMYFEDRLLRRYGSARTEGEEFELEDHPTLSGVAAHVIDELRQRLRPCSYGEGDLIIPEGDTEAGLFLLTSGRVRSSLTTLDGHTRGVATLTPGTCFGEVYVMTGNPHALAVHALEPVEALELTREQFAGLEQEDPELRAAVYDIFLHEIHDDIDRSLRSLAHARVAPMTST